MRISVVDVILRLTWDGVVDVIVEYCLGSLEMSFISRRLWLLDAVESLKAPVFFSSGSIECVGLN